jgi:hypothetical protein
VNRLLPGTPQRSAEAAEYMTETIAEGQNDGASASRDQAQAAKAALLVNTLRIARSI